MSEVEVNYRNATQLLGNSNASATYVLIWPAQAGYVALGVLGVIGNLFVLLTQCRAVRLRNIFIAALAVADLLTGPCLIFYGTSMTADLWQKTQWECMVLAMAPLFCSCASNLLTLIAGVDRLCGVVSPMRHKSVHRKLIPVALFSSVLYPLILLVLAVISADSSVKVSVCIPPTALGPPAFQMWTLASTAINVFVLAVYTALGIAITVKRRRIRRIKPHHMIHSLLLVALVHLCTWVFTITTLIVLNIAKVTGTIKIMFEVYMGLLVGVNHGCNGYIYVLRSSDYRDALRTFVCAHSNDIRPTPTCSSPGLSECSTKHHLTCHAAQVALLIRQTSNCGYNSFSEPDCEMVTVTVL